ncbi:MAG: septal ring lytic transglycosylase RlpA family protein [Deltaproteobacteria bacterium]|nr:septal ring lytic transglycosylase RlpA family protein [Deltaproteobacteria bacterium]
MVDKKIFLVWLLVLALALAGCAPTKPRPVRPVKPGTPASQRPYSINGRTYYPIPSARGYRAEGLASWYGRRFHGRKTASGERYDMYALTAAHRTLPLGTQVKVTNLKNGRTCLVRINDRGPFVRGRIIDLSYKAAQKLAVVGPGTAPVRVEAVGQPAGPGRVSPPPVFKMGPFTIQVGAFMVKANAQRLAQKLSRRYASRAFVVSFDDGKRLFYRVRIFSLADRRAAEAKLALLARDGFGDGFVVALD